MAYIRTLEIILTKKTIELVLLFHKKYNEASFPLAKNEPKMLQSVKVKTKMVVNNICYYYYYWKSC